MLRALVVAGRPLDVGDLGRKVDEGAVGRLADADEFTARAREATGALKTALASADPLRDLAAFGVRRTPPTRGALPLTPAEQAAAQSRLITEATSRAANTYHLLAQLVPETPRKTLIEVASKTIATIFGGGFVAVCRRCERNSTIYRCPTGAVRWRRCGMNSSDSSTNAAGSTCFIGRST